MNLEKLEGLLKIVEDKLKEKGICARKYARTVLRVSYGEYSNLISVSNSLKSSGNGVDVRLNCGEEEIYDRICKLDKEMNLGIHSFTVYEFGKNKKYFYYPQLSFNYNNNLEGSATEICGGVLNLIGMYKRVMGELQGEKKV